MMLLPFCWSRTYLSQPSVVVNIRDNNVLVTHTHAYYTQIVLYIDISCVIAYAQNVDSTNRPLYKAIGDIIRRKRRALDLTQDELAGKLGISRGALANIETGRQNVLVHQLYRLAAELEMKVHDLLPPPSAAVSNANRPDIQMPPGLTGTEQEQIAQTITEAVSRKSPSTKAG